MSPYLLRVSVTTYAADCRLFMHLVIDPNGHRPLEPALRTLRRKPVTILSPLRYPGSKRRLAAYLAQALEINGLKPAIFVEPFAGGASVALQLLAAKAVETIGLADADPLVASFWKTVFFDTEWLIEQVQEIEVSLEQWNAFKKSRPKTVRDQALTCLFLNRTSFSGIITRRAGPIGGKAQESDYKIDCRFPKATLVRRIRQAGGLRDRVAFVWNTTWKGTLTLIRQARHRGRMPAEVFYYFDPPFFEKAEDLYTYYFHPSDHRRFRDAVLALKDPWILSYDPAPAVHDLYGTTELGNAHVEMLYSTAGSTDDRRSAQEIIISTLTALPDHCRLWTRARGKNQDDAPAVERSNDRITTETPLAKIA
jgi:DNA adenine methylase